jgi:ABC-type antimicrobial peptide transport system permease subunit
MEIVGVVGDTRWQDPTRPASPAFFTPSTQRWRNSLAILARTSLDERALPKQAARDFEPRFTECAGGVRAVRRVVRLAADVSAVSTQVIGLFAGAAALLATVGIFSVLAYLVGQRSRELAVRRALGASTRNVIGLIMIPGLRLVAIGLALGLTGALASARLLSGLLYAITPFDVSAYVGTIAVLGGAALLAIVVPAIKAAAIPPVVVLRQE